MLRKLIFVYYVMFWGVIVDVYGAKASDYVYSDATVKAAYILNITAFVSYPNKAANINICVIGDDLIGMTLANLQSDQKDRFSTLAISKREVNSNMDGCRVLYISSQKTDSLKHILYKVSELPILTISDIEQFSQKGGMIELVTKNDRVVLHVNLKAIEKQKLSLSAKILEIAQEVYR